MKGVGLSVLMVMMAAASGCSDTTTGTGGDADATGGDAEVSGGDLLDAGDSTADTAPDADSTQPPDGAGDTLTDSDGAGPGDVPTDGDPDGTADGLADSEGDVDPDGDAAETSDTAADADVVEDTGPTIPEPDVVPDFDLCTEKGGGRNIYDLQNPDCPDNINPAPTTNPGVAVELNGVIVTGVYGDTFFVQEMEGGPYSGISVFFHSLSVKDLAPGDVIDLVGNYTEFFESSQIFLESWEVKGQVDEPAPFVAAHPSHLATNGPLAEMFEGVFVQVLDVKTTHTRPDCPHDFGEFEVTSNLRIDDMGVEFPARLGDHFESIQGPLHYSFGNHKIEPRTEADLVVLVEGGETAISKCIAGDCIAPASTPVSRDMLINELMIDPYSDDSGQEWVELVNTSAGPIDLNGWTMRDCASQAFPLAGANLEVPAGGIFVLGSLKNPQLNGDVPVDHAWGNAFYLPNTVGAVLIYDAQNKLVDQMRFSRFEPYENVVLGRSARRVGFDSDGTLPESWKLSSGKWGSTDNQGTPGAPNTSN